MCPLKDASRRSPNAASLISKNGTLSFSELDKLVDQSPIYRFAKEPNSISLVVKILSTMRKGGSILLLNPKDPKPIDEIQGPPRSILLYTSGSTSKPKIAILTWDALIKNAEDAVSALDLEPGDQWKLTLPLFHVGGLGVLIRCLLGHATVVLDDSPNVTHISLVPTHLYRFTPVYPKLKCLLVGGAPIQNLSRNLPIRTTYGLTEMGSMVTLDGKVLPNRRVKLEATGEIYVQGPSLFYGYYGQTPHQGWYATKDLGKMENGQLTIVGRKDWMFISGGENIQPEEIEKAILHNPLVTEVAVLPVNDPEFGKRPVAVVRADTSFTFKEMVDTLEGSLPKFKIPIMLFLVDEMPRKSNFKLDRFILSQMIQTQLDQDHNFFSTGQKKTAYL